MSTIQHPAVAAYQSLRRQTDDAMRLHFALLQQMWVEARGDGRERPSDYAVSLLRTMSAALVLAEGRTQAEMRTILVDVMEKFERSYTALYSTAQKAAGERKPTTLRRTRWSSGDNVIAFAPKQKKPAR